MEARQRGGEWVGNPDSINTVQESVVNKGVHLIYLNEEIWPKVLGFLAEGELFEEVEFEAREAVEYEDRLEEVIYVGRKKQSFHTPRKALTKEKARRAILRPEEAIEEEPEVDQGEVIFGKKSEEPFVTWTEGEREAAQGKLESGKLISLDEKSRHNS